MTGRYLQACDEVQRRSYRLDKRGTSGHGLEAEKLEDNGIEEVNCTQEVVWQDRMKQKEGGNELISVEDCITTERRGLYDYLKES